MSTCVQRQLASITRVGFGTLEPAHGIGWPRGSPTSRNLCLPTSALWLYMLCSLLIPIVELFGDMFPMKQGSPVSQATKGMADTFLLSPSAVLDLTPWVQALFRRGGEQGRTFLDPG